MGQQNTKDQPKNKGGKYFPTYCTTKPVVTDAKLAFAKASFAKVVSPSDRYRAAAPTDDRITSPAAYFFVTYYDNLFKACPECKPLFKTSIQKQGLMLMNMIKYILNLLTDRKDYKSVLQELARRHTYTYNTHPAYYSFVGQALLDTLEICLGEEYTPETADAWVHIYSLFMVVMLPVSRRTWAKKMASLPPTPKPERKVSKDMTSDENPYTRRLSADVVEGRMSPSTGLRKLSEMFSKRRSSTDSTGSLRSQQSESTSRVEASDSVASETAGVCPFKPTSGRKSSTDHPMCPFSRVRRINSSASESSADTYDDVTEAAKDVDIGPSKPLPITPDFAEPTEEHEAIVMEAEDEDEAVGHMRRLSPSPLRKQLESDSGVCDSSHNVADTC
eukprot:Colp12_sorted_trinity150504_noHs@24105